ncbi:Alternative dihydrofolate reductase 2 / Dihydropteroate synthase [hydrothermal vent metagenome]|uniref:dihydropteroate synthase n=1 Tax=hydrothermal vent metagenome TaxID=652676 RepID=A0A3B1E773_9ZZZZ
MYIYKIDRQDKEQFFLDFIGTDTTGAKIMAKKSSHHTLLIKDLHVGAANILKQDALSIGADLAVPIGTILAEKKYVDAVLIGSTKHLELLAKKEHSQPFGLKDIAKVLKEFTLENNNETKLMGIININNDSFFEKSRFNSHNAIKEIKHMIKHGANIIDIGAVSSRPGSKKVNPQDELKRIRPVCDMIYKHKLHKKVIFSIDSYTPAVIEYALKKGFKIVNDITGLSNDKVAKLVALYDATIVIMHMKGDPKTMQNHPDYDDVMIEIDLFFKERIKKAKLFGIKNIILDVGIGFGKTIEHNLTLIRNLSHFKHFGYPILIGASHKSMINDIIKTSIDHRLPGTLAIHLESIKQGASIIRCHDVKKHLQAIKVQEAIFQ